MADSNILRGAELAAAAKTLGLSTDEAIAIIARKQQKLASREDIIATPEQMAQAFIAKAKQVEAEMADMPADIDEYRTIPNSQLEYGEFGNQDELQNFADSDEQAKARGKRDPNEFVKYEKVKRGKKVEYRPRQIVLGENEPLRDEDLREQAMLRDFGLRVDRDDIPKGPREGQQGYIRRGANVFRVQGPVQEGDDPERLVKADKGGRRLFRGRGGQEAKYPNLLPERVVPFNAQVAPGAAILAEKLRQIEDLADAPGYSDAPGLADLMGRIEDDISPNSEAEASLVRDLIRQDREGMRPEEIARRAKRQAAREIDGEVSGKGSPAIQGELRRRDATGSETWNPMRSRAVGVKGEAQLVGDGAEVTWRRHGIFQNPADINAVRQARAAEIMGDLERIRFNSQAAEQNVIGAQAEARRLFKEGYPDAGIRGIGNIQKIGHAKIGYDFAVNNLPPIGSAYPNALPINLVAENYNAPITDNRFAGPLQRQEQFVVDYMPGYKEQGAFGNFAQVGINEQIEAARAALGNAKYGGQAIDAANLRIRNLADLQRAADMVIALGQSQGKKFFRREDGKNVVVENPGINEVLQRGGMNQRQVGDVAKAMFAIEAAKKNPLNREAKERFYLGKPNPPGRRVEFGGDHPQLGDGEAKIAMLRGEKIEGKEVRAQLQALDGKRGNPGEPLNAKELTLARMPFIGATADKGAPRANFVRGFARNLSEDEIYEKYGPVNGQIVNQVIQRAEQQQGSQADGFGMNSDSFAERAAAQRAEVGQHVLRAKPPAPAMAQGQYGQEAVIMGRPGFKENAPAVNLEAPPQRRVSGWPTEDKPVQMADFNFEGGSGSGGGGNRPTAVASPSPGGRSPRRVPADLKAQLNALSSGPPDSYSTPAGPLMAGPNDPKATIGDRMTKYGMLAKNYATKDRYKNYRRGGYAAAGVAGLAALIGGERDRREEEVYA